MTDPVTASELLAQLKKDEEISEFLALADAHMAAIGYTEHGQRHASRVALHAGRILEQLGRPAAECELARAAGYLHDMANFVCRENHGQSGAILLYPILKRHGLSSHELGLVLSAVGNHEEQYGKVFNAVCAALMIADKADVERSRVRHYDPLAHDIHDQVNYAVTQSELRVDAEKKEIRLELTVDTAIASVMDYFEIFLQRMEMCRGAAKFLGCQFNLVCNGVSLSH